MKIAFAAQRAQSTDVLVVPVFDGGKLGKAAKQLDKELGGALTSQIKNSPKFDGKTGQILSLPATAEYGTKQIVLLGNGNADTLSDLSVRALAAPLESTLATSGFTSVEILADDAAGKGMKAEEYAAALADGLVRASYRFDKYKSGAQFLKTLDTVKLITSKADKAKTIYAPLEKVTAGLNWARDLTNEPGNVIYPDSYAKMIRDELAPLGVKITILDEKEMAELGMGAALAVGQGSDNPPRMVIMEYDGTNGAQDKPLGLVGKGVTFDTGGYNLKPGAGMGEMKMDMGGSAAVVGTMKALAGRKAKTKVVAIVGLAENMINGNAYRPGDIVKSMAGKTIEIGNTDAEGRLVLADAMTYLQQEYDPHTLIDVATLTGACVMTTAHIYTGGFSNDDELYAKIEKAGKDSGDEFWRLPLHTEFANAVRGRIADLSNTGAIRWGGASTAAEFLHAFITKDENGKERSWAHLDVAGSAMPANGVASGRPVAALERLIADNFEEKSPRRSPAAKPNAKPA